MARLWVLPIFQFWFGKDIPQTAHSDTEQLRSVSYSDTRKSPGCLPAPGGVARSSRASAPPASATSDSRQPWSVQGEDHPLSLGGGGTARGPQSRGVLRASGAPVPRGGAEGL